MVDKNGTTTCTYDSLRDRLATEATPIGTLTYGYDFNGNRLKRGKVRHLASARRDFSLHPYSLNGQSLPIGVIVMEATKGLPRSRSA